MYRMDGEVQHNTGCDIRTRRFAHINDVQRGIVATIKRRRTFYSSFANVRVSLCTKAFTACSVIKAVFGDRSMGTFGKQSTKNFAGDTDICVDSNCSKPLAFPSVASNIFTNGDDFCATISGDLSPSAFISRDAIRCREVNHTRRQKKVHTTFR